MRNIIKKILREESELNELKRLVDSYQPNNVQLALIMSEGFGLKKEVLELILNRILEEIKTLVEENPDEYSDEVLDLIEYVNEIKINKITENFSKSTKYVIYVDVYYSNSTEEDFDSLFGEIEWDFQKLTGERLMLELTKID